MRFLTLLLLIFSLYGCRQDKQRQEEGAVKLTAPEITQDVSAVSPGIAFARNTELAHKKNLWEQKKAVSFNVSLSFGGEQRLDAKFTALTGSEKIRMDKKDGTKVVFDGDEVYLCPADAREQSARFDILTWHYFFAMPFKLTDPGTKWELMEPQGLEGKLYNRARLSFENNVGDSPDDWYVVYQDPETGFLRAAAYIVTYNKDKPEAEKDPHAIVFHDIRETEGIPIARRWSFHNWDQETGIGDLLGEAVINNIIFFEARQELFDVPEDSRLLTIPD